MTSEVALMNRTAVVLAADSAATVRVWENGKQVERYFKGANKIFNISSTEPVGLMIYNGAEFQGMPWEVIVKSYRDRRCGAARDRLSLYPEDLFDFITSDTHLFPKDRQAAAFVEYVVDASLRIARVVSDNLDIQAEPDPAEKIKLKRAAFESLKMHIASGDFLGGIDDAFVQTEALPHAGEATEEVKKSERFEEVKDALTVEEVIALATLAIFKTDWTTMSQTGLVFAGYGSIEFFPHLAHYQVYGHVCGRLIHDKLPQGSKDISYGNVSEIVPFAKSDMIKTFMFGASPRALDVVDDLFSHALAGFTESLEQAGALAKNSDTKAAQDAAASAFKDATSMYLWESHTEPLKQVVGLFSLPELADLAETLVRIESLKERVTKPSESVSGPVDVAVISKSDGFVWIKRKHYFEPHLNPRFFDRKRIV